MNACGVCLRPAEERDAQLIRSIFNMYQNELSAYSDDFTHLDENGYFTPDMAKEILPFGGGVFPYIITLNGKNVGFVMATDRRYAPCGADYCLEELFVIRRVRGTGAAIEAMRQITKNRPGVWSLDVYEENRRARAFWEKFLSSFESSAEAVPAPEGFVRLLFTVSSEKARGDEAP